MANRVNPDQTAPMGAVCSGSKLLLVYLNSPVMFSSCLQQTTSADDIFRCIFLGAKENLMKCRILSGSSNLAKVHSRVTSI